LGCFCWICCIKNKGFERIKLELKKQRAIRQTIEFGTQPSEILGTKREKPEKDDEKEKLVSFERKFN